MMILCGRKECASLGEKSRNAIASTVTEDVAKNTKITGTDQWSTSQGSVKRKSVPTLPTMVNISLRAYNLSMYTLIKCS